MPVPKGTTFMYKGAVRLAFHNGKVIEAKNMKTGAIHSVSDFANGKHIGAPYGNKNAKGKGL